MFLPAMELKCQRTRGHQVEISVLPLNNCFMGEGKDLWMNLYDALKELHNHMHLLATYSNLPWLLAELVLLEISIKNAEQRKFHLHKKWIQNTMNRLLLLLLAVSASLAMIDFFVPKINLDYSSNRSQ